MRPRRLRPAFLAALAALLLAAGPAPAQANAPEVPDGASDEASEGETITTVLRPGWNMVGWVGPETSTAELFEEVAALRVAATHDATTKRYQYAWPRRHDEFPTITPGMGLWLYLSGDSPVRWTRPGAKDGLVLRLDAGQHLVGVVADGAVTPPDDSEARAWRWDPVRQRYESYRFGDATLVGGEALWIEAAAPFNLWQPGTADPPFVFLGDIPDHIQIEFRAAYERAREFFAERFGVVGTSRILYIGSDMDTVRDAYLEHYGPGAYVPSDMFCAEGSGQVRFSTLNCEYPLGPFAFSGTHIATIKDCCSHFNPRWLTEGTSAYLRTLYLTASGSEEYETAGDEHIARARQAIRPQRSLSTLDGLMRRPNIEKTLREAYESLSFLAVEWLATHASDYAIAEYYRARPTSLSWEDSFLAAFGISAQDFYTVFEAHAEAVAPPLPHLLDLRREPVMVFLGDISPGDESAIAAEFERVQQFFAERFKARAEEFTVYVAPDAEAMRATLPEWDEAKRSCSRVYHGVIAITLDRCGNPPAQDTYYVDAIVPESEFLRHWWLTSGTRAYATAAYRAAEKGLDLEQYRKEVIRRAVTAPPLLNVLDAADEALGYLAVEWLVNRAGEDSLFGFYFTRSRGAALRFDRLFALSFDIGIEDFLEQFEAYRATLR